MRHLVNQKEGQGVGTLTWITAIWHEHRGIPNDHVGQTYKNRTNWRFFEGLGLPAVRKLTISAISPAFQSFAWALAMLPFPV